MDHIINWGVALAIVVGFGWMGSIEYEDQLRADAHRKETIAAARKAAVEKAHWAALDAEARRLTSYHLIVTK